MTETIIIPSARKSRNLIIILDCLLSLLHIYQSCTDSTSLIALKSDYLYSLPLFILGLFVFKLDYCNSFLMSLSLFFFPPMPSPFPLLKPTCTLLKYKPHFPFEMVQKHSILIKIKRIFSLACKCLYYLAPSSYSCLIFRYMESLALLRLGHALSCSHDSNTLCPLFGMSAHLFF